MPIPFTCPHCGIQTSVDEQYAGQSGPCAACGQPITVPPPAGTPFAAGATGKSSAGPMIALIVVGALAAFLVCGGVLVLSFWGLRVSPTPVSGQNQGTNNLKQIGLAMHKCSNNLKQIGLAMHNYHDTYRCLPAAVLTDEDDRPMRSWRVAILPFVEQAPLYDMYDFNEPWDGVNNSLLQDTFIPTYLCPDSVSMPSETSYVMIAGEGTAGGRPNERVSFAKILDGTSNTIMIIEVGGAGIPWTEPRDITVEEAVTYITDPAASQFQQVHPGGVNVLFVDGSVRFLPNSIDPETLRALLTRDDGQAVSIDF